eukprot:1158740-Rhodomonas_salina.1
MPKPLQISALDCLQVVIGWVQLAKTGCPVLTRCAGRPGLDPVALQTKGALLIPSVFGAKQVSAIAAKLAEENICGSPCPVMLRSCCAMSGNEEIHHAT